MQKRLLWLATYCIALLLSNCTPEPEEKEEAVREGYRPLYLSRDELQQVFTAAPHPLKNAGKIYVRGSFVFVNELNKGIHIINNQNPANPQNVAFLHIPGNVDIAVKDNILYADNGPDLLALDISNPVDTRLVKRIANVFPNQSYPPQTGVSFECVDNSKGVVIGWEKTMLTNPKCRR